MQTFLPYSDFQRTAKCLDQKRLGKQRIESKQILDAIRFIKQGNLYVVKDGKKRKRAWINHPAVLMWLNYEGLLQFYYNIMLLEWEERGFQNIKLKYRPIATDEFRIPAWLGDEKLHSSHRANLLRKAYGTFLKRKRLNKRNPAELIEWYGQFGWTEDMNEPYYWPKG